jgi:hypothetical protein
MDQVLITQNIIMMFLVFLAVFMVIYAIGKRPVRRKEQKIYACGEDIPPERLNVPQDSFYRVFVKSLRIVWLERLHSGNLSDYLLWIVLGLAFMVIVLSMLW